MYTESFWYPCHGRMRSSRYTSRTRIASAMTVSNPLRLSLLTPLPQIVIFLVTAMHGGLHPWSGSQKPPAEWRCRTTGPGRRPVSPAALPFPGRSCRLNVGKAGHELFPARGKGCCQGIRKDRAILIGQGVEEPGISDTPGLPVQLRVVAGVRDNKMHVQTPCGSL